MQKNTTDEGNMVPIKNLQAIEAAVKGAPVMRMAVACAEDPATIHAVAKAAVNGLMKVVLIGHKEKIIELVNGFDSKFLEQSEIVHVEDETETAHVAVQMVHAGKADALMKGLIGTATFMKAILDKNDGLLPKGNLLTHVAVMDIPSYPKLLLVSDAAIIPTPDVNDKVKMLNYNVDIAHVLGIEKPKVALISAAEKINFRLQSSIDAAVIKAMADRHQIVGAIVDGPLALDVSLSEHHCQIKGLDSPINGSADILIFPNIETANTFYKSATILANGRTAAMVVGASVPIVLTSRADEDDTKYFSILLALLVASKGMASKCTDSDD